MTENQNLGQVAVKHAAVDVVFAGDQIMLPKGMEIATAIKTLEEFMKALEKVVPFIEQFNVFPWDGSHALRVVLERKFGWVSYGGAEVSMEVAPGVKKSMPWGKFKIPGVDAEFNCDIAGHEGRIVFQIHCNAKRKCETIVREIFKELNDYLAAGGSIYQGKAIKLDLNPKNPVPIPTFIDTSRQDLTSMYYSPAVQEAVEVNLFTPIRRITSMKASGIPFKRGILLSGTYGVGKTLAATASAKIAVQHNVTFIYIKHANQLASAISFASMYATPGAVIFCEDIDRVAEGERDAQMDELLNIIDGIDTKSSNIMVVLTTNDVNAINPALLRPGRLDAVIEVTAPDAETATRIIRSYCGDKLDASEDLTEVGHILKGQIPATLHEVVKRAKLSMLSTLPEGEVVTKLTAEALEIAARGMSGQLKLLQDRIDAQTPTSEIIQKEFEKKALELLRDEDKSEELVKGAFHFASGAQKLVYDNQE